ncbi:MAG: metallophosphoesterase [Christensenellaceae bacterium]|jgi:predicted phosphohydrolase|nr:metallophosphoesterase [Christensenellaceae bacterium]
MRVFAISDLHLGNDKPMTIFGDNWDGHWNKISLDWDSRVNDDDIVIVAGDLSWGLKFIDAMPDLEQISQRKGQKIFIKGNHDLWWTSIKKIRNSVATNMHFIQNDAIKINNLIFAGSRCWTVPEPVRKNSELYAELKSEFDDEKIFARETLRLRASLECAKKLADPGDIIIGITHFPPFNSTYSDSPLTSLFEEYKVSHVIYGHLHGTSSRAELTYVKNSICYYLTSCDKIGFKLIEIPVN